jgi:hypothetical protein
MASTHQMTLLSNSFNSKRFKQGKKQEDAAETTELPGLRTIKSEALAPFSV